MCSWRRWRVGRLRCESNVILAGDFAFADGCVQDWCYYGVCIDSSILEALARLIFMRFQESIVQGSIGIALTMSGIYPEEAHGSRYRIYSPASYGGRMSSR